MIKFFLTLIIIYVFIQGISGIEPDERDNTMVDLPSKTLGRFESEDAARRCGAILGRAVRCDLPRNDRARLITYCADGLADAGVGVNAPLYEAFLDGTGDGERNAHGWSCASVGKTLTSPMLPRS
jgi:hypothetical protein